MDGELSDRRGILPYMGNGERGTAEVIVGKDGSCKIKLNGDRWSAVDRLKCAVPPAARMYDPHSKTWMVHESHTNEAINQLRDLLGAPFVMVAEPGGSTIDQQRHRLYLASATWQRRRDEFLRRFGKSCFACGSRENLAVHHVAYDRANGEEYDSDLRTLCRRHHDQAHKYEREQLHSCLAAATDRMILDVWASHPRGVTLHFRHLCEKAAASMQTAFPDLFNFAMQRPYQHDPRTRNMDSPPSNADIQEARLSNHGHEPSEFGRRSTRPIDPMASGTLATGQPNQASETANFWTRARRFLRSPT